MYNIQQNYLYILICEKALNNLTIYDIIASMYDTSEEEIAEIEKQAVEYLRKYCNIRYRRI